ncbi:hypothetical protein [Acinetobacter sp. LoGeW2-3]|uniref:hypothetical protein n=1 Tax=Acinetobacter sp. LoGeW2-3 TaxID=1808001 RepID=UPI00148A8179|nr:hypothetical protein [Acinetobacter sp. LoGeW2-3]
MADFDDDFDLEEPYQDNDLYPDSEAKNCTTCSGTGYDSGDGKQCAECLGSGKAGEID